MPSSDDGNDLACASCFANRSHTRSASDDGVRRYILRAKTGRASTKYPLTRHRAEIAPCVVGERLRIAMALIMWRRITLRPWPWTLSQCTPGPTLVIDELNAGGF